MKANPSEEYKSGEKIRWHGAFQEEGDDRSSFNPVPRMSLKEEASRVVQAVGQWVLSMRYGFAGGDPLPRLRDGAYAVMQRLPWWKIGLLVLAVFVVLKKDIQFSIDMKAPVGAAPKDEESSTARSDVDEMTMARPTALKSGESFRPALPSELENEDVRTYVDRYADIALAEKEKYGIPASVLLGHALMESHAGRHPAVAERHNHFGSAFAGRSFANDRESWRAFCSLLYQEYPAFFDDKMDYREWAAALYRSGLSNLHRYDRKLIEVIEKYQLYLLDN